MSSAIIRDELVTISVPDLFYAGDTVIFDVPSSLILLATV